MSKSDEVLIDLKTIDLKSNLKMKFEHYIKKVSNHKTSEKAQTKQKPNK